MSELLLDAAGRRRSPATMPGFHAGQPPRSKGRRYPGDPPTVEEIVAVIRAGGDGRHGCRLRGLIVVLWRAGLRIHDALALNESDLDRRRGSLLVRRGKGGRRREVGMDEWAWEQLQPWTAVRLEPLWDASSASSMARRLARRGPVTVGVSLAALRCHSADVGHCRFARLASAAVPAVGSHATGRRSGAVSGKVFLLWRRPRRSVEAGARMTG